MNWVTLISQLLNSLHKPKSQPLSWAASVAESLQYWRDSLSDTSSPSLVELIKEKAPVLQAQLRFECDAASLLCAIAEVESAFGKYNLPKHENSYDHGGRWFNRLLWTKWGAWAACSYSSFQIMFPVAVELGFTGSPMELADDRVAIDWVIKYIEKRILRYMPTRIDQIADAYNSGSFRDYIIPYDYINKFLPAYKAAKAKHSL